MRPTSTRSRAADRALHFSPHDDFAGIHVSGNLAVRSDGDAALGKMNAALHFPVDVQIFAALNFAFDQ